MNSELCAFAESQSSVDCCVLPNGSDNGAEDKPFNMKAHDKAPQLAQIDSQEKVLSDSTMAPGDEEKSSHVSTVRLSIG